jgi:hypothetical protein
MIKKIILFQTVWFVLTITIAFLFAKFIFPQPGMEGLWTIYFPFAAVPQDDRLLYMVFNWKTFWSTFAVSYMINSLLISVFVLGIRTGETKLQADNRV